MEFIQQNLFMIAVALISGTMLLVLSVRRPGGHNALSPAKAIQKTVLHALPFEVHAVVGLHVFQCQQRAHAALPR